MCLRPFGSYCSACLGILFVSILCMCCSHFSWYCFISFTIFSAPVFSLIQWFFSLSSFVIPRRCLSIEFNLLYRSYACFVRIMFVLCVVFIPAVMMSRRNHQTLLHMCMMKRPWRATGSHRKLGLPEKFYWNGIQTLNRQ